MPTWKSKICRGMDVVESITFTRQDFDLSGKPIFISGTYVPGADEEKPRSDWSQAEIDAIGEKIAPSLDAELERLKNNPPQFNVGA